jgi:hypothetical protein
MAIRAAELGSGVADDASVACNTTRSVPAIKSGPELGRSIAVTVGSAINVPPPSS